VDRLLQRLREKPSDDVWVTVRLVPALVAHASKLGVAVPRRARRSERIHSCTRITYGHNIISVAVKHPSRFAPQTPFHLERVVSAAYRKERGETLGIATTELLGPRTAAREPRQVDARGVGAVLSKSPNSW